MIDKLLMFISICLDFDAQERKQKRDFQRLKNVQRDRRLERVLRCVQSKRNLFS